VCECVSVWMCECVSMWVCACFCMCVCPYVYVEKKAIFRPVNFQLCQMKSYKNVEGRRVVHFTLYYFSTYSFIIFLQTHFRRLSLKARPFFHARNILEILKTLGFSLVNFTNFLKTAFRTIFLLPKSIKPNFKWKNLCV
jgi:hypothetical protein